MEPLPEPVERVAAYLRTFNGEARIEEFSGGTPTARDAADAVGCELGQIVKSLVFVADGRALVVLVPGDRRADTAKIARAVGATSVRVATPEQVETATGFRPGAVAPFPLPRVERVLIDRTLLGHDLVWAGAGSERHMIGVEPAELVRLTRARLTDAVEAEGARRPG